MEYKTFNPCIELSPFVKCFWTLDDEKEEHSQKQRIVPDGCMEMIFHHGDLYRQYFPDGNATVQPRSFVFGQITSPLDIEPTGATGIFAVRFLQDGFTPFSIMPAAAMENRAVPLEELFDRDGLLLQNDILAAQTTRERIEICEEFFLARPVSHDSVNDSIRVSIEMILKLHGDLTVDELSEEANLSRRQLERKFSKTVGLSPKQLSKIIRLQSTLKKLFTNEFTSLTEIAHEANYHDQSHFIRDFKEFTDQSPKKFFAGNLKMSSLFYGAE